MSGTAAEAAENAASPSAAIAAPGLIVTIGAFAIYEPDFEGAKRYETVARPVFNVRRPGQRVWLDVPDDGIDFEFVETSNFRAGPVGALRYTRDTNTIDRGYRRVGKVDLSAELGAFAEYWPSDWLRTRVEVRGGVVGAEGVVADFGADFVQRPNDRLVLTLGPRLSIADVTYMNEYYGVTAAQSVTSGIAAFKADAGLRSFGAIASTQYKITDDLTSMAFAEYRRLAGDAGDSTLIEQRGSTDQFKIGVGLKYQFHVDW
jgi:outer membrane scaffolding protein for murein synthesis (MipA/OmpV family)